MASNSNHPLTLSTLVCSVVLNVLATLGVVARVLARRKKNVKLGNDDWTIIASLVCSIAMGVVGVWASVNGIWSVSFGKMSMAQWTLYRKVQFGDIIVLHFIYGLVKISVLLFYKNIFTRAAKFRMIVNIFLALVSIWMISFFVAFFFCSQDVHTWWSKPPAQQNQYRVINLVMFTIANSGIDVAFDIAILALPLPVIRTLNMNTSRKVYLAGIFLLGAFCLISSIIRLKYANELNNYRGSDLQHRTDLSLQQTLWGRIEASASVFTACLPTLGPFFGGTQSVESILGSVRSIFTIKSWSSLSLGSRSRNDTARRANSRDTDAEKAIYKSGAGKTSAETNVSTGDAHGHAYKSADAIVVQHTFGTEHSPR